jgi:hypothetical protein
MSTNRFFNLLTIIALLMVVAVSIRTSVVTSAAAPEMDSATRSYIAWGNALKAANKEGVMVPVTGYGNALDSATRSYIAWGNALKAANKEDVMVPVAGYGNALDSATRSYIAWGNALKAANSAPQPLIAWAKACGVDLSYANNVVLDSATRSYISWAKSAQCGNTP